MAREDRLRVGGREGWGLWPLACHHSDTLRVGGHLWEPLQRPASWEGRKEKVGPEKKAMALCLQNTFHHPPLEPSLLVSGRPAATS